MLVVTRKRRESILIGGDIQIKVISTRGSQVRLGIVAPPDVAVDRTEIREQKLAQRARGEAPGQAALTPQQGPAKKADHVDSD
jgi:carbon storage regulator